MKEREKFPQFLSPSFYHFPYQTLRCTRQRLYYLVSSDLSSSSPTTACLLRLMPLLDGETGSCLFAQRKSGSRTREEKSFKFSSLYDFRI